jgi:hypothetical protein
MVECDLSNTRLLALTPIPSPRIFKAIDTIEVGCVSGTSGYLFLAETLGTGFAPIMLNQAAILKRVFTVLIALWLWQWGHCMTEISSPFILYATN